MASNDLYNVAASGRVMPSPVPANALADVAFSAAPMMVAPRVVAAEGPPGVPTGVDGRIGPSSGEVRRLQSAADARRAKDAMLSYGDTTLIPSLSELGEGALDGLNRFGELALAFGPQGEMLSAPIEALGTAVRAYRAAPRAGVASVVGERALTKPTQEQALTGLRSEVDALTDQASRLGIEPGVRPDVALSPEEEINALTFMRDSLQNRVANKQAALDAANASAPPTSVPSFDGISPIRERAEMLDALTQNPYVQPIPGQQGLPTKQRQIDLANQFFERGGRLPEAGPWGRDMPAAIRDVLQSEASKAAGGTGPRQLRPGYPDIIKALQDTRQEGADLANRLRNARSNEEVADLQRQLAAVRRRSDSFMRMWEEEKARNLPKPAGD